MSPGHKVMLMLAWGAAVAAPTAIVALAGGTEDAIFAVAVLVAMLALFALAVVGDG